MDDVIGTAQVTRPTSGTSSNTGKTFIGRWVSPLLGSTTQIDANTWTVNFAATDAGSGKFPVTGSNAAMIICCYVWRPGSGIVGTIADTGTTNTSSTFQVGTTTEKVEHGTFSGSAVASVQSTDVLCIELWSNTISAGSGWAYRVYFDGTTENTTGGTTVSNHAAFIETPQTLTLPLHITKGLSENVTVSEPVFDRLTTKNRGPATETITISESLRGYYLRPADLISISDAVAKVVTLGSHGQSIVRAVPTETITIAAGTLTRLLNKFRTNTETLNKGETLAKKKAVNKTLSTESITVTAGTLNRLKAVLRTFTETTTSTESVARPTAKKRALATENITVGSGTLTKVKGAVKAISQTVTSSEGIVRLLSKIRVNTENVTKGETLVRLLAKFRTNTETVNKGEVLARQKPVVRALSTESVPIIGTLTRLLAKIRINTESITASESIARLLSKRRTVTENTASTESTTRVKGKIKALVTELIVVNDGLTRLKSVLRTSSDTITIGAGTLARLLTKTRPIPSQSVSIADSVDRIKSGVKAIARTLVETITIAEVGLNRLLHKFRVNVETVNKSETLTRTDSKSRTLPTETVTKSESISRLIAKVRVNTESVIGSDSVSRLLHKFRVNVETVNKGETVVRQKGKLKTLTENVNKGESISRVIGKLRVLVESSVTVVEALVRLLAKKRAISTQSVTITDSVDRFTGAIHNIVRIIEEPDIIVSDAFIKARQLTENVDVGEFLGKLVSHFTPVNILKSISESVTSSDSILRRKGKKASITELDVAVLDNTEITHMAKVRKRVETVKITSNVSVVNGKRTIALGLSDSVSVGDLTNRQAGKVRRIGGIG